MGICWNWCIVRYLHGLDFGINLFLRWGFRAFLDGNQVFSIGDYAGINLGYHCYFLELGL